LLGAGFMTCASILGTVLPPLAYIQESWLWLPAEFFQGEGFFITAYMWALSVVSLYGASISARQQSESAAIAAGVFLASLLTLMANSDSIVSYIWGCGSFFLAASVLMNKVGRCIARLPNRDGPQNPHQDAATWPIGQAPLPQRSQQAVIDKTYRPFETASLSILLERTLPSLFQQTALDRRGRRCWHRSRP